jgi:DNA-binding LacI/PurR family transcriptional regulator
MAKKITITELAKRLGVSVCTVNKALSGKSKVSEATRQRVVAEAKRLGYRPNRMAQVLARNPIRLVYLHPAHFESFFAPFEPGVRQAAERLVDHQVSIDLYAIDFEKWHKVLLATVQSLTHEKISGLILSPVTDSGYQPVWDLLAEHRTPLVQLGMEMPGSPAALTVRQDSHLNGRIAAELLSHFSGPVVVMIGNRQINDHDEKLRGFQEEAARRGLTIATVCEHEDDPKLANAMTRRLLREHPRLGGIYIATDNFSGIARALREERKGKAARRIKVVATGVFPEIQAAMDDDLVHFALDQRMAEQGELAVRLLHDLLSQRPLSTDKMLLPPRIVVRGNIELFTGNYQPLTQ